MAFWQQSFSAESISKQAKSTALHALQWIMATLLASMPIAAFAKAPGWMLALEASAFVLVFLLFLFSYVYLLFKDRDALRSEEYTLSKMAIERGLIGDSKTGFVEATTAVGKVEISRKKLPSDGGNNGR